MGGLSQMLATSQAMHTSQLMHLSQLAPPGSTPVGMGVPPAMVMTAPIDLSALLAGVLSGPPAARQQVARMFADPGSYKLDQAMETPATPELLATLSALQSNMAMSGAHLQRDLLAGIDQQVRSQSHPLDQLTIELVTMVFDYILDDTAVPDTVKAEIARLQIIAVKAALLDRTFFARRQHPMRQLLDRIAHAAQDPDVDTAADSPFIVGLRGITNQTINAFDDDLAVFEMAQEQLEQLIAAVTQAQRTSVETATLKLAREEQKHLAETEARTELRRHLNRHTPGFVREFLYNWWTAVLAHARVSGNETQWQESLEIAEALVWSVSPLRSTDVQRLAALLPRLMRGLMEGMNAISMPAEAREAFFDRLMETHTAAVNNAKNATRANETPPAPVAEAADDDWTEDASAEEEDPDSGFDGGDLLLHTVKSLERGAIVEFLDDDASEPVRCKLSWISPKQTVLLFTSSVSGARKFGPEALAAALGEGKARLIEEMDALVDRAFSAMVAEEATAA